MFRRVLPLAGFAVLVTAAALAQAPPPPLTSTQVSGTVFLALDAVQAQVNAVVSHAAASRGAIAEARTRQPLPVLASTPITRR
jgi:hypothetical protein